MRSLSVTVCLLALAFAAFSQSDRGTITGTVSDPAGGVVAGAAVEARNVANGAVYAVATSNTGNYTIAQLPAGNYELDVTVAGFKKFIRTGLLVEVAGTLRIDAVLEVGAATESVTVEAAAPLLKTEGGEVSHNISITTMNELPVLTLSGAAPIGSANTLGNIRNPLSTIQLLPGARQSSDTNSSGILRVNGMPSNSQAVNIEGQDATNGMNKGSNQIVQPGVEAIQEVAVQTSNYSAEYGQAGGGYFNYTMKSGTNQLHGSGFDYFVNESLKAGLPFTDAGTTNSAKEGQHIRNPQRQNDYGFTLGGPITIPKIYNGHDRTFFFFSFEQFRQSIYTSNTIGVVPTAAQRQGDFSAALNPTCNIVPASGASVCLNEIFDPLTNTTVNGVQERTPFPNNKIPLSRIDPTAAIVQNMIPLPNTPGLFNYTAPPYLNFRHSTIPSIKLDHIINSKMKLSAYYSWNRQVSPQTNGFTEPYTALQPQRSTTDIIRLNLDTTLTPTVLLHFGAGYLELSNPSSAPGYDQKQLFPNGVPFTAGNYFPYMTGMFSANGGGWTGGAGFPVTNTGVAFTLSPKLHDYKPTFNASLTWVKGNHTYKLGATALFEGTQGLNDSRAQGEFTFAQQQTADPSQNGLPFANFASSGFAYASFFLGLPTTIATAAPADERLGDHAYGIYAQDSWKVTRKLTFNYGIRWDYAINWKEQYGRQQNAAFNLPNPLIGGRIGSVEYLATCHCQFDQAYPFAFGPHLGVAYQITPKTVFRAGGAISYAAETEGGVVGSSGDFYSIPASAYGLAAGAPGERLADGDPEGPGNKFGNPVVHWPNFTPQYPVPAAPGVIPPSSPFISIAKNTGRLPRTFQWSLGFQRELTQNLVVDAAYVGNRGAWWEGPLLAGLNYNALTPQQLLSQYGLNVQSPADTTLLNSQINSPAVLARFPYLANPNNVYPGFPATQTLLQALRPYPQWNGIPPFQGPPDGNTWYDSLQIKATQRLQRGLSLQVAYTWEKELTNGTNSNFSYVVPSPPLINDVFNKAIDKQISSYSIPQLFIIAFSYQTPKWTADSTGMKALSWVARDWTLAGILRYQSGLILQSPFSSNNLLANLARGPANNPALWGGGYTFLNRVPGQPLFLVNPNSKFDPTQQLALNPAAWVEPPYGTFGTSAPYFNDFRWQRQPAESASFGRVFSIGKEGRYKLQIRAEFQNIFNRLFYSMPADGSPFGGTFASVSTPTLHGNPGGTLSQGYGFVNFLNGAGAQPRGGQIVARFQF
jgi:Carboxypeptidase regulatory-like domain